RLFEQNGFNRDEAQATLLKFQDALASARDNPGGNQATAFRRLGLDPEALASTGTLNALEATINALHRTENQLTRTSAARDIFARDFLSLTTIVEQGARAFDRAEASVRASGTSGLLDFAGETQRRRREIQQQGQTAGGVLRGLWEGL